MKKMSTMLGLIFFSSIFFTLHEAKAQTATLTINGKSVNVSASSCDDAKSLAATDYCVDEAGKLSIVTNVKTTEGVFGRTGKVVVKHRHLTKKELIAFARGHLHGQLGDDKNATVCTDGTGCTTVPTNNNSVTTTDNNSPNTNVSANDNVNTNVSNRPGRDRRRNRNRPSSTYRDDPRVQAQVDFDMLKDFCGGLEDRIIDRDQAIKDIDAQIAEIDEVALKNAEQKAYRDMLKGCRHNCIELAMVKDGVCSLDKKAMASVVSKEDLDHGLLGLGAWFGAQSAEGSWVATSQPTIDPTKICTKILGKPECKAEIVKSGLGDCPESVAWLAALKELTDAQLAIRELKAKQSTYAKNSTKGCNVSSAADVDSAHWDNCSSDCLQRALDSCPRALADADIASRGGYCADCGVNGQGGGGAGGTCIYGPCNVSKAAQILGAIGGIVTPMGLGFMQMSMNNNNNATCMAMYAQQMQVSQTVGLPPTGPNCGGMSGMGGGYNPMMMGGMGMGMGMGMGGMPSMYNPMMGGMGMGMGQGMYNPMMGGMGMGMGQGMYNPMMGGMGFNAGINLGMNPMMGGMGMGYNPMMGQGMYNPMMGGMGMGYNPMSQQMSMQNQMYNAQLQMQQNAAQQMAIQQSMMGGYNNAASMYGMNNMYQSPMYGMGASFNPMMMGGMGMGNNYGYGQYYNPMSMYGGGINAGLNFNAGFNMW